MAPKNTSPAVVPMHELDGASGGNASLRRILERLGTAANAQATKTSTSSKGPPDQSSATATFHAPIFIVTISDPGDASAATLQQAAQQAASATTSANASRSIIYHQVQAATSVLFDNASSVQTFGGEQGSVQPQFVIGTLDTTKSWIFRVRTSFDGVAWNQWKLINQAGIP